MVLRKHSLRALLAFFVFLAGLPAATAASVKPNPVKLLFWSTTEQVYGYQNMEAIFPFARVSKGNMPSLPIPRGKTLVLAEPSGKSKDGQITDAEAFMRGNKVAGLLVIHNGSIVLEKYREGFTENKRWTSFSMAKSLTSILVGCAFNDGSFHSLDDTISRYLPQLAKGAYADVTLRQVLTMTSGTIWNENYSDPSSDVAKLASIADDPDASFLSYMAALRRSAPPGTRFSYSTGESTLLGYLVRAATGKGLAAYMSEKVWTRLGMEHDALWVTDRMNREISGCCFSASLRDYGRLGLFMLRGGKAENLQILPKDWIAKATEASRPSRAQGRPYGFQWWVRDNGAYQATGIFGQMLHIDPKRELVIVMLSFWPRAGGSPELYADRTAFIRAIKAEIDRRSAGL